MFKKYLVILLVVPHIITAMAIDDQVSKQWGKYGDSQLAWDYKTASPAKKRAIERFIEKDISSEPNDRKQERKADHWLAVTQYPGATGLARHLRDCGASDERNRARAQAEKEERLRQDREFYEKQESRRREAREREEAIEMRARKAREEERALFESDKSYLEKKHSTKITGKNRFKSCYNQELHERVDEFLPDAQEQKSVDEFSSIRLAEVVADYHQLDIAALAEFLPQDEEIVELVQEDAAELEQLVPVDVTLDGGPSRRRQGMRCDNCVIL